MRPLSKLLAVALVALPAFASAADLNFQSYKSAVGEVLEGSTVPIAVTDMAGLPCVMDWLEDYDHPSATPAIVVIERAAPRVAKHFGHNYPGKPYLCFLTKVRGYEGRADKIACYSLRDIGPGLSVEEVEKARVHAAKRHVSWTGKDTPTTYTCMCQIRGDGRLGRVPIQIPVSGYNNERLAQLAKNCHSQCSANGCDRLAKMKEGRPLEAMVYTSLEAPDNALLPGDAIRPTQAPAQKKAASQKAQQAAPIQAKPTQAPTQKAASASSHGERRRARRAARRARRGR